MAILVKGHDFSPGDQVTDVNLEALVEAATFDTGAVDGATTQLSSGAIIVKDGGITPAKLSTGGPTWAGNVLTITQGLNVGNDAQPGMPVNISGGLGGPLITFKESGTNCGRIRFDNSFFEFDTTTSEPFVFKVNGTERARISSTGLNSTVIGATTPATGAFTTVTTTGNISIPNAFFLSAKNAANTLTLALIGRNASDQVVIDPDSYGVAITGNVGIGGAATATSPLNVTGIPTSSAGLASGDVWSNGGVLTIVT